MDDYGSICDRLDELRALRSELRQLTERADELDVELDEAAITRRISEGEKLAAALDEACMEDLRRAYEVMAR